MRENLNDLCFDWMDKLKTIQIEYYFIIAKSS